MKSRNRYTATALLNAMLALLLARIARDGSPLAYLALLPVLALPALCTGLHIAATRKAARLMTLAPGSHYRALLSGYWTGFVLQTVIALGGAALMMVPLLCASEEELLVMALGIPCVWMLHQRMAPTFSREWKEAFRTSNLLRSTCLLSTLLLLLAFLFLRSVQGNTGHFDTLESAINTASKDSGHSRSLLVTTVQGLADYWSGIKLYLGQALTDGTQGTSRIWAYAVLALGSAALLHGWCRMLCASLMTRQDLMHAFGAPAVAEGSDAQPPTARIVMSAALLTLLFLFWLPHLAATGEQFAQEHEADIRDLDTVKTTLIEMVDHQACTPGTIAAINRAGAEAMRMNPETIAPIEQAIRGSFDRMEANVDPFLDWYYSLPAEYARIAHMILGDLEQEIDGRLRKALQANARMEEIGRALDVAGLTLQRRQEELVARVIASNCSVALPGGRVEVSARASVRKLLVLREPPLITSVRERFAGSTAAGGAAAMTAITITKKLAAKGSLKLAGKAAAKVAAKKLAAKTAGAAVGSWVGALIGSVVPGPGNAAGILVGGFVGGTVVGVGTDAVMLKLEERFSRKAFRADILEALHAAENEFLEPLRAAQHPPLQSAPQPAMRK